jgi:hypothetical protein
MLRARARFFDCNRAQIFVQFIEEAKNMSENEFLPAILSLGSTAQYACGIFQKKLGPDFATFS